MNAIADWIRVKARNGGWPDAFPGDLENRNVIVGIDVSAALPRQNASLREADLRVSELAAANRRKDEFLAILSHELRSPLASIRYAVAALGRHTESASGSPQRRMHTLIERQLGRMTGLLDELLDVSRIANGRLRLLRERTDLRVVLNNAIETLEPSIQGLNQRLSIELPDFLFVVGL